MMEHGVFDIDNVFIEKYKYARYNFYKWRYESSFAYKTFLALGMACLTGLGAQLRIYLPFTPVPITGQVFFVLLSGILLGKWWGGLSQGFYACLGVCGVPWFAGWRGGIKVLLGVTGGYIIGFVLAAIVIGWFIDRYIKARRLAFLLPLMLLGIGIIYVMGAVQFCLITHMDFRWAIALAVLPFIPLDVVKALGVAFLASVITPKRRYNGEVDE